MANHCDSGESSQFPYLGGPVKPTSQRLEEFRKSMREDLRKKYGENELTLRTIQKFDSDLYQIQICAKISGD